MPLLLQPRHLRSNARRLLAATILLLQGGLAVSPMLEPRAQQPLGTHAEAPGAKHFGLHNESTCPTCALRAMHAAPATASQVPTAVTRADSVALDRARLQESPGVSHTNRSRAPPTAG